jgi:hypothetical protein
MSNDENKNKNKMFLKGFKKKTELKLSLLSKLVDRVMRL